MTDTNVSKNLNIAAGLFIKEKQYWTQKLSDAPEKNSFHYDYKKNIHEPDVSTTVQYVRGHIDGKCFNRLIDLSRGSDPILHMVLAAAVTGLSAKYTGNKDIIIGTSIDKQDAAEGLVNTILPLRTQVDGNMTFKDLLLQIRQTVTEAIEHQNFPIETLLPSAGTGEDEQEFPLYDVSVILENIQDLQYISHINNSIVFIFLRKEELIEINVQYNALLYEKETLERILTHYFILLEKAVFDVNVKLDDIEIITEEEKKQLIDFNNTRVDYPETPSLHRLFERQAARTPDQAAVILADSHTTLSYKDLNNKANQLAHLLKARGVKPGVVVPLLGQRSLHLIIGMLGILKAGGAFLPMDSDYPGERKAYILEDSGAKIVLTTYPENSLDWVGEVLNITDAIAGDEENIANLENVPVQPNDLAYIIYTSGSTGKPKGVMIEHRGILDYSYWAGKHYVKDEPVNFPLFTSISFDLTMTSIFTPLTTGNAVVVYEGFTEVLLDRIIDDNQVAVIKLTPSHLNLIKENKIDVQRSVIKRFIVGGEILETKTAAAILENFNGSVEIINEYGPTEATVGCMRHTFDPRKDTRPSVPIGVPADNCRVYLLDGNQKPVPPGAVGEMYLAGKRLARGYWRQPGLTAESFITITADDGADMQMYRTGDLARWRPGGYLEFLGRADQQLKIRGFRIEPGEIESRLLEYEGIENAVVTAVTPDREKADPGDSGGQYLCAYFVSGLSLTMVQLKEFLSGKLPQYMIPTYFVQLPEIPLTPNGKVDKKALPQPGKDADTGEEYVAPRNEIEARLAKIWQELLGVEKVGINDSYFSRGGDSIKAIQIASRLQELNLKLEVRYLFQYPTIKGLSAYISETKQIIDQDAVEGEVKLTPIQEWFFRMNLNAPHHFNQAVMVAGPDGFDETAIREIFTKIIHHHDALRMIYKEENREITQVNCGLDYPIEMEVYDFKGKENAPELIEQESDRLQTSINLEKGPLMKLGLFHLDRGDRLLIVIHHLVIDGVSWRILFEDFESLYLQYRAGEPLSLPLKTDSFKLWADELTRYADSRELLKEKDFWAAMEDQVVEPIKKDFDEEKNYIKDTGSLSFSLTWEETERLLTKVNKAFGTQVNEILLTALGLGIEKTLGIKKPAVTLESHGREEIIKNVDIKRTVGWFTTVYPVLLDFSYGDDQIHLAHRIKETKETLRRVPNKGFNYGILKYLTAQKHKKDIRFKLNPQISFNYLGQFDTDTQKKSFISTNEPVGKMQDPDGLRQHLLEVTGIISGKQLSMSIIYNKKQFKTETMEALLNAYQTTLQQVISYCESRQKREWTPTDFTYRGLSIRTVDQLQKQYALEEIYALSPMQEGMLFHALYEEDTSMYFEQASFRLHGDLEETLLKKSLDQLLKRHDVLRTAIIYEGLDRPVQLVIKDRQAGFLYKDIRDPRHREEQNKDAYIEAFKQSDRQRSFLLAEDVLIRLAVLRTDEYQYQFVWSFHHVLMDGWCTTILVSEYFEIYKSLLENRAHHLPEIVPYRRFIQWLDTQDREVSRQFWTRYLAGYDEPAALPALEKFKKDGRRYHSQTYDFQLDKKTTNALNRLASVNQVTLNTLMQTVWGIIAAKYNRTDDAVFGAVVSGRPSEITGVETMVGLFINTVPVRINSRRHSLFNSLLAHVQEKALESEPHHYFPLAEIQALSPVKQNLLDHIVIFENYPISEQINDMLDEHETPNRPGEFKISHTTVFEKTNYDFNIIVVPREKILIKFEYNDNAYEIQSIERIAGYMKQVFETVIENPGISIHDIEILTEAEKKRLLIDFNCTRTQYPEDKTIHQLFEQQAQKTPERIAVMEPGQLSYGELNRKAHRLAHALEENGVKPGSIVSLSAERSMEIIVAIMGMLKAGAAYLPIDPEYPEKRKQYILSDSGTSLLITQTPGQTKTLENGSWKGRVIPLADLLSASEPVPASIDIEVRPADPVYVIYTSGSTGKPKGVMIRHRGLVNYICWAAQQYIEPYEPPVNFPLYSSLSFDLTVTSIFTPLITGNAVIVYQGEDKEFLLGKIIFKDEEE
ncbi:MAG: amino acid adenylation domain-containing protein [bacterium]|nr:amino acid adenylation domain-containing protein [bacterium]